MQYKTVETPFGHKVKVPEEATLTSGGGKLFVRIPDEGLERGYLDWPVWKINGVEI